MNFNKILLERCNIMVSKNDINKATWSLAGVFQNSDIPKPKESIRKFIKEIKGSKIKYFKTLGTFAFIKKINMYIIIKIEIIENNTRIWIMLRD